MIYLANIQRLNIPFVASQSMKLRWKRWKRLLHPSLNWLKAGSLHLQKRCRRLWNRLGRLLPKGSIRWALSFRGIIGIIDSLQLLDFDRFNNSLTKLRDKKEKSMSDEKNLFKVWGCAFKGILSYLTFSSLNKTLNSPPMTMIISIHPWSKIFLVSCNYRLNSLIRSLIRSSICSQSTVLSMRLCCDLPWFIGWTSIIWFSRRWTALRTLQSTRSPVCLVVRLNNHTRRSERTLGTTLRISTLSRELYQSVRGINRLLDNCSNCLDSETSSGV